MYFTPHDISASHHHTIANAQGVSHCLLDSTEKVARIGLGLARQQWEHGLRRLDLSTAGHPALPLQALPTEAPSQLAHACEALLRTWMDSQQMMIRSAQTQIHAINALLVTAVERDEKSLPQESSYPVGVVRRTLQHTEQTLAQIGSALTTSGETMEGQVNQVLAAFQSPASRDSSA